MEGTNCRQSVTHWTVSHEDRPGLRERKKLQTRENIRRVAFRLFESQGYGRTTVEQIAAEAEISPSTFFRYFPTKEYVVLSDDLMEPIVAAFEAAPADLTPVAAYRHAVASVFGAMTPTQLETARIGQRMMYATPEASGLLYKEYVRLIVMIADAIATRHRGSYDPFERRVLAGAIVGVLIACSDETPVPADPISDGLAFLDSTITDR